MTGSDQNTHAETALDDIYHSILNGNFAALPALLPAVEQTVLTLAQNDPKPLERLKEKATRNAVCLDAALSGFRSARRRLAEIEAAEKGLSTYNRQGGKQLLDKAGGSGHRV